MAAKKKNTEGMAFLIKALKKNRTATYSTVKAAAEKKGLTVWPIMFGRAQLLLGYVRAAKRGTGKYARATAAKAAGAMMPRRGPGRPRKNPLPADSMDGLAAIVAAVK
ncbi:MAG TPA: hypothetical protein VK348_06055, partial [Planctomycetota bacterium]|nr:hypothetical protein [Planctomycetota bacterium]